MLFFASLIAAFLSLSYSKCPEYLLSYGPSLNELHKCVTGVDNKLTLEQAQALLKISLPLDSCIRSDSKLKCDEDIKSLISLSSNSFIDKISSNLLTDLSSTCTCIDNYAPLVADCFPVIDNLQSYCAAFNNPFVSSDEEICSKKLNRLCHISNPSPLNESFNCVFHQYQQLNTACRDYMTYLMSGLYDSCYDDLFILCSDSLKDPFSSLSCLTRKTDYLSNPCKFQLSEMGDGSMPCEGDINNYCPFASTVHQGLQCLKSVPSAKLERSCRTLLIGYDTCLKSNDESSTVKSKDREVDFFTEMNSHMDLHSVQQQYANGYHMDYTKADKNSERFQSQHSLGMKDSRHLRSFDKRRQLDDGDHVANYIPCWAHSFDSRRNYHLPSADASGDDINSSKDQGKTNQDGKSNNQSKDKSDKNNGNTNNNNNNSKNKKDANNRGHQSQAVSGKTSTLESPLFLSK